MTIVCVAVDTLKFSLAIYGHLKLGDFRMGSYRKFSPRNCLCSHVVLGDYIINDEMPGFLIVACHHPLFCCMDASLFHPYILQHFTLVHLV